MKFPSLFGARRRAGAPQAVFDAALAPAETLAVIGDIHGCDRLLGRLLDKLAPHAPDRLVFVGDFVDRGEESRAVIDRLFALSQDPAAGAVFLRGNHEEMMLGFLDAPAENATRWLRFGGLQTLASYGIGGVSEGAEPQAALRARDALAAAIGPERLAWLRALPRYFVSGNVAVVHAGANPAEPIEEQRGALVWGHRDFARVPRRDGMWVVHGHTVTDAVAPKAGRIGVDTGAYATGILSAVILAPGRHEVVSVDALG
jgi:serine/threonine protein phosphatase 1